MKRFIYIYKHNTGNYSLHRDLPNNNRANTHRVYSAGQLWRFFQYAKLYKPNAIVYRNDNDYVLMRDYNLEQANKDFASLNKPDAVQQELPLNKQS